MFAACGANRIRLPSDACPPTRKAPGFQSQKTTSKYVLSDTLLADYSGHMDQGTSDQYGSRRAGPQRPVVRRLQGRVIAALLSFIIGPMVFTNLYFRHEYYYYGAGIFLIMFLGLGIIALIEKGHLITSDLVLIGEAVSAVTQKEDVVLIYGGDWNSAIMDVEDRGLDDPNIQSTLKALGRQKTGWVVIFSTSKDLYVTNKVSEITPSSIAL
jgi:hypothetical protein